MSTGTKLVAIHLGTVAGRILMGVGCGLFVRTVTKQLTQDCGFSKKAVVGATAFCTAWALGHAVDCYWDKTCKILAEKTGVFDASDMVKKDLENILEEMET